MRFLLIEDDEIDAELVKRSLAKAFRDCTVREARCLDEAVGIAQRTSFDAVLADLSLPDSSGIRTVVRMVDASLKRRMLAGGASEFLTKPVTWDQVSRSLRQYTDLDLRSRVVPREAMPMA